MSNVTRSKACGAGGMGGEGRGGEGRGGEGRGGEGGSLQTLSNVHYYVSTLNIFNSKFI